MDTQGLFNNADENEDMAKIFAMSSLLSSVVIYNVQCKLNTVMVSKLMELAEYGIVLFESKRVCQSLVVLVRDWRLSKEFGSEGGLKYLTDEFKNAASGHITIACESYQNMRCFLMKCPNTNVAKACETSESQTYMLKDIGDDFLKCFTELKDGVMEMIEPMTVSNACVNGADMIELLTKCTNSINSNKDEDSFSKKFAPQTFTKNKSKLIISKVISDCIVSYVKECQEVVNTASMQDLPNKTAPSFTNALEKYDKSGLIQDDQVTQMRGVLKDRLDNSRKELSIEMEMKQDTKHKEFLLKYNTAMTKILRGKYVDDLERCHIMLKNEILLLSTKTYKGDTDALVDLSRSIETQFISVYQPRNEIHKKMYDRPQEIDLAKKIFAKIAAAPLAFVLGTALLPFTTIAGAVYLGQADVEQHEEKSE